ncbi:MAG: hypothetical protein M3540_10960 [Actinomycetota bacterium]|nr:hypothetical protein [Actinomycetota bacterium]
MATSSESASTDDRPIVTYTVGLCAMSVCAKNEVDRSDIEAHANREHPTGISSRWEITDEPFADGTPNPTPCNQESSRSHYLLHC